LFTAGMACSTPRTSATGGATSWTATSVSLF
jgi:hypothetical protein